MRRRYLFIVPAAMLALGLGFGCKKGGEKKAEGGEAMDSDGMRGMRAKGAMDAMDAMDAPRPEPDRRAAADTPPARPDAAADKEAVAEGVITEVKGTVEIRRAGKNDFEAAAKDAKVFAKDAVRVGKDGEASLALWDNSTIELPPESAVTVNPSEAVKDPAPSVTLMAGAARFDVNPRTEGQGAFAIYTPSTVVNVQGTVLAVGVGLSGSARVAVETGKVELVPVVKVNAPPVQLPAGKVVVVPFGQAAAPPAAYQPANAGWDEWLEAEDKKGAAKAGELAGAYATQVDGLAKEGATLDDAGAKADDEAAKLAADAAAAEKKNDQKAYVVVQPKLASTLDTREAIWEQRRLVDSRLVAQAYLLGLMQARIRAGVYKVPPAALARVEREHARALRLAELRRQRALARYRAERQKVKRWQRAYYVHHPRGRALAPKVKVVVPKFYAQAKLRPSLRRAPVRVVGYNRPLYRRPVYRGKYVPYRPVAVAVRPGQKPPTLPVYRARTWERQPNFKKVHEARLARQRAQREAWRKAVIARRMQRWGMRPDVRRFERPGHPGMMPPPHGMGPHGMMPPPHGMGPLGPGPHGMMPPPHGRGPMFRGPAGGPGPMGRRDLEEMRRRRMERREMMHGMGM